MKLVVEYFKELFQATREGWDTFWFAPRDATTLGVIRILAGGMLFYTHAVWASGSAAFFGEHPWITREAAAEFLPPSAWSYLWNFESPGALAIAHALALLACGALVLGLFTRISAILTAMVTIAYAQRVPGALYGLDQINGVLALYLALGPCGDALSVDNWLRRKRGAARPAPSIGANLAIRLMQVHLCVIYLFAGLSKLQGDTWWNGWAFWGGIANLEYQTVDLTFLANYPRVINFITHTTLVWEILYAALVWPRLTRPLMIALAVPVHLGIALCMGMPTFGMMMLFANMAFISEGLMRRVLDGVTPAAWRMQTNRDDTPLEGTFTGAPHGKKANRPQRARAS